MENKILDLIKDKRASGDLFYAENIIKNKDSLFFSGVIFLIGAISVAVLNYLYHLFMGRMLGPSDYGILGSLFALIYISTYATTAFNLSVSKFSAEFNKDNYIFANLIKKALLYVSVAGLFLLLLYFIFVPYIALFLNINSYSGLVIVGIIAYLSLIFAVLTGALNGMQSFIWQNSSGFFSALTKFVFAVVLVYIGFSVGGALIAVFMGTILGIIISCYPLASIFKKRNAKTRKADKISKNNFNRYKAIKYFFFVFIASITPILFITLDQVLVKHYFSSSDAGFYVAAGTIAKIIWFGSGFLVGPLFPKVVSLKSKGKDSSKLLFKALVYTGALVVIGSIAYFIIPTFIVSMLYGPQYLVIVPLIGLFAIAMGLFSITQILIIYNLAVERKSFLWILLAGLIAEVAGIYLFHNTLSDVIKIVFAVNFFVIISLLLYNKKEVFGA